MADGRIRLEEAYAQGKMLDHSAWRGRLSGGSTFLDYDMVRDVRDGEVFQVVELKYGTGGFSLSDLSVGQRRNAEAFIVNHKQGTLNVYCMATHQVSGRQIDTVNDINGFGIAFDVGGKVFSVGGYGGPEQWKNFNRFLDESKNLEHELYCAALMQKNLEHAS